MSAGMAGEWQMTSLREVATRITKGTTPTRGEGFVSYGINYIKSESITPDGTIDVSKFAFIDEKTHAALARSQLRAGNVLFSMAGVYLGKTAVVSPEHLPANTNQAVGIITLDESKADPRFVHYSIQSPACRSWVARSAAQSAQPNFNLQEIGDLPIPAISLEKQRAIAHILGTLDEKIELNRKQNETLEAMARALFKAWFVDFEPVRAKMEGRWQRGQSLPGLPAHLYDLFPDRLIESELGEIPEGWRHSTIGAEVTVCGGSTPSTKSTEFWEGGQHHWATPKDLSALKFPVLLDTDRKITDAGLGKISSGLLPVGTVLLSSRAPIGYLAIAEVPTAINQGFIAMKCDGVLPNVFVLAWCRESMDAIVGNANGSTFQEISKGNFRPIPVFVPTDPVLKSYQNLADSLYRRMVESEEESRSLAQLRDTLLPKLISGELRITDTETFLKERHL